MVQTANAAPISIAPGHTPFAHGPQALSFAEPPRSSERRLFRDSFREGSLCSITDASRAAPTLFPNPPPHPETTGPSAAPAERDKASGPTPFPGSPLHGSPLHAIPQNAIRGSGFALTHGSPAEFRSTLHSVVARRVVTRNETGECPRLPRAGPCPAGRRTLPVPFPDGDRKPPRVSPVTRNLGHCSAPDRGNFPEPRMNTDPRTGNRFRPAMRRGASSPNPCASASIRG